MSFSLDDKHILVHYHYIEDLRGENVGMNPCPVGEFEEHLKFLSKHYQPASLEEVYSAGKENAEKRYFSITLDDGLMDQRENAVPLLKKYGVQATFFIITQVFEHTLPSAHKLHLILSRFTPVEIIDVWNAFLVEKYPEHANRFFVPKDKRIVKDRRLYADIPSANIKETFTAIFPDIRDAFLDYMFETHDMDSKKLCAELFMDTAHVKELSQEGFAIGVHTHAHETLDALGRKGFHEDFQKSKKWYSHLFQMDPTLFSYPYGIIPSWGPEALQKESIKYAVTVEERSVAPTDTPLLVPRHDMASLRDFLAKQ